MRKVFVFLSILVLLISSCSTTMRIRYRQPSRIDMGSYRNIAIASSIPYRYFRSPDRYIPTRDNLSRQNHGYIPSSYDSSLSRRVASALTDTVVKTLSESNYFESVMLPDNTDRILSMENRNDLFEWYGVDAIVIPKVDSMSVQEFIYSNSSSRSVFNSSGEPRIVRDVEYHYDRTCYLVLSVSIVDASSERLIGSVRFPLDRHESTLIGPFLYTSDPYYTFRDMISSISGRLERELVPTLTYRDISLMRNKPKLEGAEIAYSMVEEGRYIDARNEFLRIFNASGHLPSGYNASLITAAIGDLDGALLILSNVNKERYSEEVAGLYSTLLEIKNSNEEARKQLEGIGEKWDGEYGSALDVILEDE